LCAKSTLRCGKREAFHILKKFIKNSVLWVVVEAVASEAVCALQEPRNREKQGIFALSGLQFTPQVRKIHAITVA